MKTLAYISISFLIFGCSINSNKRPFKKPFVIIYKFPDGYSCNSGNCSYRYIDANGRVEHFCESEIKYDIGDTIH